MEPRKACELCNGEAVVHCESDSAFLCWACDAVVHGANFLVARHARRVLCLECGAADPDHRPVSGPAFLPVRFLCRSCNNTREVDHDDDGASSSDSESSSCCSSSLRSSTSSSCVSSAESGAAARPTENGAGIIASFSAEAGGPIKTAFFVSSATESECSKPSRTRSQRRSRRAARRELDARAEGVLLNWCRRVGLDDVCAFGAASYALDVGLRRAAAAAAVPFRVIAAAAVWFAAKLCCADAVEGGRRGVALLKRLEACSGVPARFIVMAEARLSRAVRRCHPGEEGEGWAECS